MLQVQSIRKTYGSLVALEDISIDFLPGEIHALLGENGAGKSTLVKILSGFVKPDTGSITLDGKNLPLGEPMHCRNAGVAMVHQHFMLVNELTVAENLALHSIANLSGSLDAKAAAAPALEMGKQFGWNLNPEDRVEDLSVGVQQRIEILKALSHQASVIIFDEPTAVLSPDEVDELFRVLADLRNQGKIVILIAHKLAEVLAIADRITVLRLGRLVAQTTRSETTAEQIGEWMIGGAFPQANAAPTNSDVGEVRLTATDLTVRGDRNEIAVKNCQLTLHKGEILGIGGVDGNGQVELAEALAGVRPYEGRINTEGSIGYIPQDRQHDGLALNMSLVDNFLITGIARQDLFDGPFLSPKKSGEWMKNLVTQFGIKVGSLSDPARSLSGGNQQKIVVSRVLSTGPEVIVAVNPTRGLDFRSTQFVHRTLAEAAAKGAGVVFFSTDHDELEQVASRILYMGSGNLYAERERSVGMA